ncbi:kti12, chromatin associated [Kickxella alabastrina]|uniref:Kti12, chromatin associated n=1 Tax=Kickxella alabastrina TaxID=61397 RepID=A0ACC1INR5_9FUNG|nr:kti12, chromatin associated [Kickxella alabastrina]
MPLILMTGYPSSGKSTRAHELKQLFETRLQQSSVAAHSVHIVDDALLGYTHAAYASATEEKNARGALLSAVERQLSRDAIVIADTPNYIKGLRYQLYCIAREVATTHCVVHCAISREEAQRINSGRGSEAYPEEVFEALIMRYEEPNAAAKWDSPLFTVIQHDKEDVLPFDAIWAALVEKRALAPNFSTAMKPATTTNYLSELERATQHVISAVLDAQKSGVPMHELPVPGSAKKVRMPGRNLTLSELRRLRMQFTKLNRQVPLNIESIADIFVEYLNINL